jgi:Carboxypeptidase regulatory-like domain
MAVLKEGTMYERKKIVGVIVLLLLSSVTVWAALNGDIEGVVRDTSGAIIPSANITIISVATGAQRTLISDERGYFIAAQLPIGEYDVRVQLAGFKSSSQRVLVKSAERASLNITLEVGGVSEVISVTETAVQLLNTTDAQLAVSIEERRVKELPLATRDPLVLATLSPGVIPVTAANPFLGTGSFNANGGRGRGNNITIDNVVSTDVSTTGGAGFGTLSLDAIQEFKLITNNFNAEFGRNANAQVQIITKGGSNQFHGSAYEFLRNDVFNSRDYFDTTGKASILRRNQFGATAGGPIIKERMFFFGHYEGLQIRGAAGTRSARVPTAAQRAAITDATSAAILSQALLPAAAADDATGAFGTVPQTAPVATENNAWSMRIDRNFGAGRDVLSGRYAMQKSKANSEGNTFITPSNLAGYGASSENKPQNFSLGWTRVLHPTVVNEARFAFGRSKPNFIPQSTSAVPRVIITGFDQFGESDIIPQGRVQNTFQYSDTLTYNSGRHTWKYGGDVHRIQANSFFDSQVRGIVRFTSWNAFAAGQVQQWQQNFGSTVRGNRVTNVFGFAQDDFKVRPDLTINLGLRLEVAGGVSEVNGILSNLDPTSTAAIGGAGPGPLGTLVLGGTAFERNYNWEPRVGFSWSPNHGKWVVRGGYGITHDFIFLNPITNLRFAPPFVQAISLTGGITGTNSYANLFAGTATIQSDARTAVGKFNPTQVNFGNFSPIDRDLNNPQVQQWNLTVEHQLTASLAAKVSYVGNVGHYLLRSRHRNMISPGTVQPATSEADEIARIPEFTAIFGGYSGSVTTGSKRIDPRFNAVTMVEGSANSNYNALEAQLVKRFSNSYQFHVAYTWSKSIDNASDVLGVLVNDAATVQNPFNLRDNRSVSQYDIPHRLVINHVYEPQFFRNVTGPAGKILRGWGFNGIFQTQSGFPTNIFSGSRFGINDISMTGNGVNFIRPTVVGDISKLVFAPQGSPAAATIPKPADRGINTGASDRNTNTSGYPLVQPLLGNVGTLGRNVIRLNGLTNFDWVILKNTQVNENLNVQFRSEFYNVFNNTSFARFDNDLSSQTFGLYRGTDTTPRQIQFALKLIW